MSGYRGRYGYQRSYGNPYGFRGGAQMLRRVFKKKTPLKKVQKDVRFLKRAIEIKQADLIIEGQGIPAFIGSSSSLHVVNQIIPGNTYTQRVGNKIALKDLHVRAKILWRVSPHYDSNAVGSNAYRVLVVYDKFSSQANGSGVPTTTPAFNTIFQDRQTNGTTHQTWLSQKNHDLGDRFVVLHDKVRHAPPVVNPLINEQPVPDQPAFLSINFTEDFKIPLKGRTTCFNVNEITEGALYLIFIAQTYWNMSADSAWNEFVIAQCTSRLRYYDI